MQVYIRTDAGKNYLYDGDCMSKGKESKVNNGKNIAIGGSITEIIL